MRKFALVLAGLAASAPALAIDVLVVGSDPSNFYSGDVQTFLAATGAFTTVDLWNANASTPALGDLLAYDAIILQYDYSYADTNTLGNNIADYLDAGGGVVAPGFDWGFPGLGGRFAAGYHAMQPASPYNFDDRLASNTGGFSGPYLSGYYNAASPAAAPGATPLAFYDDGGLFIAAWAPSGAGISVAVNDYVTSNGVGRTDFWDLTYDGANLWANALVFAANGGLPSQFRTAATGTCGGAAQINTFDATPNGTLIYASGTPGASTIPSGPCAGRSLPIRQPRIRATRTANNQGRDTINIGALNPNFCGGTYVVVDVATCSVASATLPL